MNSHGGTTEKSQKCMQFLNECRAPIDTAIVTYSRWHYKLYYNKKNRSQQQILSVLQSSNQIGIDHIHLPQKLMAKNKKG